MRLTFGVGPGGIAESTQEFRQKTASCHDVLLGSTWLMTSILVESTAIGPSFVLHLITNRHVLWLSLVSVRQVETQRRFSSYDPELKLSFFDWPATCTLRCHRPPRG